jgi:hypothetical protein
VSKEDMVIPLYMPRKDSHSLRHAQERMWSFPWTGPNEEWLFP